MFEQFVKRSAALERYRSGPFADERQQYLAHLCREGRSRERLEHINRLLLVIASWIDLDDPKAITPADLKATAQAWAEPARKHGRSPKALHLAKADFVFIASSWLRFLGRLDEPATPQPFAEYLEQFLAHLKEERGFAAATLDNRRRSLGSFFGWLSGRGSSMAALQPADITAYFRSRQGTWKRITISFHVQSLRSFLRYGGSRGWCRKGIDRMIEAPRLYTYEHLPQGPSWEQVQRLIQSESGEEPVPIRNRAVLLLLAVYGFRVGEVCALRLDNVDWSSATIHLRRTKPGRTQSYPLTEEVGEAIIRYLKRVRPQSTHRELFLSLKQPYRPLSVNGLGMMVRVRLKRLGLQLPHYGPHALRHACASHLMSEGFSLKEIGDHLGHVSQAATRIYSKVDLASLREVAAVDLAGLVEHAEHCRRMATPVLSRASLAALREVARLGLGGLR